MASPFPGMDPYLEQHWRDVHHNLITFIQGAAQFRVARRIDRASGRAQSSSNLTRDLSKSSTSALGIAW